MVGKAFSGPRWRKHGLGESESEGAPVDVVSGEVNHHVVFLNGRSRC